MRRPVLVWVLGLWYLLGMLGLLVFVYVPKVVQRQIPGEFPPALVLAVGALYVLGVYGALLLLRLRRAASIVFLVCLVCSPILVAISWGYAPRLITTGAVRDTVAAHAFLLITTIYAFVLRRRGTLA